MTINLPSIFYTDLEQKVGRRRFRKLKDEKNEDDCI